VLIWAGLDASALVDPLANFSVPTPPTWTAALIAVGVVVQIGIWALLRHYDDDELKAKVKGLLGRGSGGQPDGGI
jgi:hypothetical protein